MWDVILKCKIYRNTRQSWDCCGNCRFVCCFKVTLTKFSNLWWTSEPISKASETVLIFFPLFSYRFSKGITESGSVLPCICFLNMYCGFAKVRRLSTASSVTKPPHFILTTEWIWYWKDEYGKWQEYGKKVSVEKWGESQFSVKSAEPLKSVQCFCSPPLLSLSSSLSLIPCRWTPEA